LNINQKLLILATAASVALGSFTAEGSWYDQSSVSSPSSSNTSRPPAPPSTGYSRPSTATSAPTTGSGYSRPSVPPAAVTPAPQAITRPTTASPPTSQSSAGQGYGRPGAAATVGAVGASAAAQSQQTQERSQPTTAVQPQGAMAQAQARNMSASSLQAYQAERSRAQQPPTPVTPQQVLKDPVYANARTSFGGNPDRYWSQRTNTINNYRTAHPEVFTYSQNMRPNYGIFDSSFLTGMMVGAIGTGLHDRATWMASQQHQPWYPQYRADLEQQAKDNAELRARLDEMDREINIIRAQNKVPQQPQNLPQGVDPTMAISPEAVNADAASKINRGSGYIWAWIIIGLGITGAVIVWTVIRK